MNNTTKGVPLWKQKNSKQYAIGRDLQTNAAYEGFGDFFVFIIRKVSISECVVLHFVNVPTTQRENAVVSQGNQDRNEQQENLVFYHIFLIFNI